MKALKFIKSLFSQNYKAYLIFLGLTLVLWFTIQLVKSYTFNTDIRIQLVEIPNYMVVDTTVKPVQITLTTNGFKLWVFNLSNQKIDLSYKHFKRDSLNFKISADALKDKIKNRYNLNRKSIEINESSVVFNYRKKETKKVPVKVRTDLKFKSGFNTLDSIQFSPDSIVITGSKNELENIDYIQSQKLTLDNIKDTLSGKINLNIPSDKVKANTTQIDYYLPVEKFSEKTLMVDIETINVPDSLQLSTYPAKAKVSFLVSLKSYDKVSDIDFQVICDYEKRYEDDAIMIPKLEKVSDKIINPKLQVNKVDYLIKQKP